MLCAGPRNRITDVPGLAVGQAEDRAGRTGVTVLLADPPAMAAVDVRGGAPGTRETDLMQPACLVERVDAIVLSGGSAFGLAAADGVLRELARQGRGFAVGAVRVPIVPAAILFDLLNGGAKPWMAPGSDVEPPYAALGRAACAAAGPDFALGNAGAGLGAKAGRLKGGLGSASALGPEGTALEGLTVGALVAANPVGSVVRPGTDAFWAAPLALAEDGLPTSESLSGMLSATHDPATDLFPPTGSAASQAGGNTTLAVVATDADLTRAECQRLAIMAQDGLARAIRPCHTPFDGDSVFALATGRRPLPEPRAASLYALGALTADTLARAVMRGVFLADGLGDHPGYRDWREGFRKDGRRDLSPCS